MEYIIITGASKGLGRSLARKMTDKDKALVLIARDKKELVRLKYELENKCAQKILIYPFDLNNYDKAGELMKNILSECNQSNDCKITFINNAGSIHPIKTVNHLVEEDIKSNLTVNILSPIFIISKLIEFAIQNKKELKVINISSGAYKQPINSWALYCTSKAAIQMYLEVAFSENKCNSFIKILSVDPGVMDTEMQKSIRTAESKGFDKKDEFINLYRDNKLRSTNSVAKIIKENFIDDWNVESIFIKLDKFFESK